MPRNKGGRPKSSPGTALSVKVTIRFTEAEADQLMVLAYQEGVTVSDLLRSKLLSGKNGLLPGNNLTNRN